MKAVVLVLIKGYRYFISPLLGPHCRFNPTCSDYSMQCYQKFSFWKATKLSVSRILKCHPWSKGGDDYLKEP